MNYQAAAESATSMAMCMLQDRWHWMPDAYTIWREFVEALLHLTM
jgi:hypothetical protein